MNIFTATGLWGGTHKGIQDICKVLPIRLRIVMPWFVIVGGAPEVIERFVLRTLFELNSISYKIEQLWASSCSLDTATF